MYKDVELFIYIKHNTKNTKCLVCIFCKKICYTDDLKARYLCQKLLNSVHATYKFSVEKIVLWSGKSELEEISH